ncbi:MAG TPA: HAMP domain-containing sensor histidine kinase [Rhodocyclaceae bacterium]|nr:HAMP domain-containing sensor histidine kinase [Rhodocyclaceae bacterium]
MNDATRPDLTMFLASSVHDMKNSISMMIGTLQEIVGKADPESHPHYRDMAHMLYETQRINGNLIQLLTLYKFDNDLYPFSPDSVALADFVREAQSHVQTLLDSKQIAFEADLAPDLYGEFDQDLVTGVIVHAMNNAANYTRDRIRLAVAEIDGELEFRVEDNGRGFPKAMIEEGAAAMRGTDFGTGSTGLGLYFSAVVAKMHRNRNQRGSIRLENGGRLGGGCFVLRLP